MAKRSTASSIDEYIAGFPPETQKELEEVRAAIRAAAPDATERISYAIPTFDLNGRHLVHFAGHERHIGFYPVTEGVRVAFEEELKAFKTGRAQCSSPWDGRCPWALYGASSNSGWAKRAPAGLRPSVTAIPRRMRD